MILETILESIRSAASGNLSRSVEWAAHAIRSNGLLREALARTETAEDLAGRWLHARLAAFGNADQSSLDACWARVVDGAGRDVPDALLERARLATRRNDPVRAARFLKEAFFCECNIAAFLRAETLCRKVFSRVPQRKNVKIALLASSTTTLLKTVLELLCWRDGFAAEFYEPDFGTYSREILSPDSHLYEFRPDFIVLLENWRDIELPQTAGDAASALEAAAGARRDRWNRLLTALDCSIIYVTLTGPAYDPALGLSRRTRNGSAYFISNLNQALVESAPERVYFVDAPSLAAKLSTPWEDALHWSASRVYPAPEALPLLAESIVSNIRHASGLSSKVLALDLDNILWGGIIGEDGIAGIKLGPPSPVGERYQQFQHYLKELSARGIVLAVTSKNNPEDAMRVFTHHDASVLKLDDFAVFQVNWTAKAESLRSAASSLRLGLDSFVFLDDNPVERAAIRQQLPDVIVPNISGEPAESIRILDRFQFFQVSRLTEEDRMRAESYRALAAASGLERSASPAELIESLQISVETGPVNDVTINRATQLINKTNQFNLTTRRYSLAEVTARANSRSHWFRWYRVRDRFADHGLIGIMLVNGADTEEWFVDLWLMSCRVIGRNIEDFMFNSLLAAAQSAHVRRIIAEYLPLPKNALAAGLLPSYGFVQQPGTTLYALDPRDAGPRHLPFQQPSLIGANK